MGRWRGLEGTASLSFLPQDQVWGRCGAQQRGGGQACYTTGKQRRWESKQNGYFGWIGWCLIHQSLMHGQTCTIIQIQLHIQSHTDIKFIRCLNTDTSLEWGNHANNSLNFRTNTETNIDLDFHTDTRKILEHSYWFLLIPDTLLIPIPRFDKYNTNTSTWILNHTNTNTGTEI